MANEPTRADRERAYKQHGWPFVTARTLDRWLESGEVAADHAVHTATVLDAIAQSYADHRAEAVQRERERCAAHVAGAVDHGDAYDGLDTEALLLTLAAELRKDPR